MALCNTGIYTITCIPTRRVYVGLCGRSQGFEARWRQHKTALNKNKSGLRKLQNAWNKYGEKNFKFEVHTLIPIRGMKKNEFYKLLRKHEVRILKLHPKNLNCTLAGDGGMTWLPKSKKVMSERVSGKGNPMFGKKHSKETLRKISENIKETFKKNDTGTRLSKLAKDRCKDPEYRKSMGHNKGRKFSKEVKEKVSRAVIKRFSKLEERKKYSRMFKGKNNPMYGKTGENAPCYGRTGDIHPMYGTHHSLASKSKISNSLKKLWAKHRAQKEGLS